MARAKYIYLVRLKASGQLLGTFTVKHEAHTWAQANYDLDALQLSSMPDGVRREKTETPREW